MILDIQEIQRIIPHRFPFLLIDKIIECEPNKKLVAIKNVTVNEQFFAGHFPGEKVMPGVLIIEAMAQAGCVYFYYSKNMQGKSLIYYLAKVNCKFKKPVVPGDQIKLEITTKKMLPTAGFFLSKAIVSDEVVAEAEIGFGIKEI